MKRLMIKTLFLGAIFLHFSHLYASNELNKKSILVTGASSGIGNLITKKLAKSGFFVYAGARKEKDIIRLNMIPNVMAVQLDVTIQEDIDAMVKIITNEGRPLYGPLARSKLQPVNFSPTGLSDNTMPFVLVEMTPSIIEFNVTNARSCSSVSCS